MPSRKRPRKPPAPECDFCCRPALRRCGYVTEYDLAGAVEAVCAARCCGAHSLEVGPGVYVCRDHSREVAKRRAR